MQPVKQKKQKAKKEVDPSLVVYRGPIVDLGSANEEDCHTQVLTYTATLGSDATGTIATFFVNNITFANDWSSIAACYDEYRILGVRLEWFPYNRYSKVTTICVPLILSVDRTSTSVPASYAEVMSYASAEKHSIEDPWTMECRMTGVEDAVFTPTGTAFTPFGFKCFGTGFTVSTTYGRYFYYWRVQFRGRK